eukprot:14803702-Ditylum_brightwellii.AAC.1
MKQIAFKHGLLDVENLHLYQKESPNGVDNNKLDDAFSLKAIISPFTDFVEEKILLQQRTFEI